MFRATPAGFYEKKFAETVVNSFECPYPEIVKGKLAETFLIGIYSPLSAVLTLRWIAGIIFSKGVRRK